MANNYANEKEALEACIKLWGFLEEYPWSSKRNAYAELNMEEDYELCPMCAWDECNRCKHCLIWGPKNGKPYCYDAEYGEFAKAETLPERRQAARKIKQLAIEALEKFNERKNNMAYSNEKEVSEKVIKIWRNIQMFLIRKKHMLY